MLNRGTDSATRILRLVILLILFGCQQTPTRVVEESVDVFEPRTVLMDTRSPLDYASYHIEGSANLLVEDFVILKNPLASKKNQRREFDPHLESVIERLAMRGIAPDKRILLIGAKKDSVENKKWKWLLNNLEVPEVEMVTLEQVRKMKNGRFAAIEREAPWKLKSSESFQKEFVLRKVQRCFVQHYFQTAAWSEKYCL